MCGQNLFKPNRLLKLFTIFLKILSGLIEHHETHDRVCRQAQQNPPKGTQKPGPVSQTERKRGTSTDQYLTESPCYSATMHNETAWEQWYRIHQATARIKWTTPRVQWRRKPQKHPEIPRIIRIMKPTGTSRKRERERETCIFVWCPRPGAELESHHCNTLHFWTLAARSRPHGLGAAISNRLAS